MIHHGNAATAAYAYDGRDRCTKIEKDAATLAEYTWLGNAISRRDTTCDYPGGTKPKFKTDFQRDGILRVTTVDNEHLTPDQDRTGFNDLGEFDYTYDSASNVLSAIQAGSMAELDVDRAFDYDTLNRLITARVKIAVKLDRRLERLGVGFRVYVRIFYDEAENAITLPRTCLFRGENGA